MNEQLLLMCSHFSPYMCGKCAKCGNCCACVGKPLPRIQSTMSRDSQERLRELRRAQNEAYGQMVKPT